MMAWRSAANTKIWSFSDTLAVLLFLFSLIPIIFSERWSKLFGFIAAMIAISLLCLRSSIAHRIRFWRRICVAVLVCLALGFLTLPRVVSALRIVAVKPAVVAFTARGDLHSFTIKNQSEDDIYAVAVIFTVRQPPDTFNDLELDVSQANLKPLERQGDDADVVFADIAAFGGRDQRNSEIFLTRINRLNSGESRQVNFILQDQDAHPTASASSTIIMAKAADVTLVTRVMSYSSEQLPISKEPDGTLALPITVTEDGITLDHDIACFVRTNTKSCDTTAVQKGDVYRGKWNVVAKSWKGHAGDPNPAK